MNFEESEKFVFWSLLLSAMLYEIWIYLKGKSSLTWIKHPAIVTDVGITVGDEEGSERFKPYIRYEYTINDSRFQGKRIAYGDLWSRNYGDSTIKISGIYKGKEINIFVNPTLPKQSTVYNGYKGNILWEAIISIALMLVLLKI